MNMNTYLTESARTVAGDTYPDVCAPGSVTYALQSILADKGNVDAVKKGYYYGKEDPHLDELNDDVAFTETPGIDKMDKDVVHAILGIVTEGLELAELLVGAVNDNRSVTRDDLIDEGGDLLWYLALLFRRSGTTFEEVAGKNIAKLRNRFPGKFSLEDWDARDKDAEKQAQLSA